MTPREKLNNAKRGKVIITNDQELDSMLKLDDDAIYSLRTLPNPKQVGAKDQYVAWIGEAKTIGELFEEQ